MEWSEALRHTGNLLGHQVYEKAKGAIQHYIFTTGDEKHREGLCTCCERWVDVSPEKLQPSWVMGDPYCEMYEEYSYTPFAGMSDYKFTQKATGRSTHLSTGFCPECGQKIQFRSINKGHKTLHDRFFLIVYDKSRIDPESTVICIGYEVNVWWSKMDICGPGEGVPIDVEPMEVCVFRYGKSAERFLKSNHRKNDVWVLEWRRRRECKGNWSPGNYGLGCRGIRIVRENESLNRATEGTPFERLMAQAMTCGAQACYEYDGINVMTAIAKYPCIEYMFKLGYRDIVRSILDAETERTMNLRGKTAQKVFQLTKDEWAEVRGKKLPMTIELLKRHRWARANGLRVNMETCAWMNQIDRYGSSYEIKKRYPALDIVKIMKYCKKTGVRTNDYLDHVNIINDLRMDMTEKQWMYPRDFQEVHAELSARLKIAKRDIHDADIQNRMESGELDEYWFSANGLVLRPFATGGEIVDEGTVQKICIGRYVQRYAEGKDVLCCLRKENALNVPMYAVEFGMDGERIQCRSFRNGEGPLSTEVLDDFWRLHSLMREDMAKQRKRDKKEERKTA